MSVSCSCLYPTDPTECSVGHKQGICGAHRSTQRSSPRPPQSPQHEIFFPTNPVLPTPLLPWSQPRTSVPTAARAVSTRPARRACGPSPTPPPSLAEPRVTRRRPSLLTVVRTICVVCQPVTPHSRIAHDRGPAADTETRASQYTSRGFPPGGVARVSRAYTHALMRVPRALRCSQLPRAVTDTMRVWLCFSAPRRSPSRMP